MIDNVSALKEQGGEAGNKDLVTAAKKIEPFTVAGQLPVPFQPTVSAFQAEIGELSHDVQRKSKGVNPAILVHVDNEPISGGPSLATPPLTFTGESPAPDFNPPKGVSLGVAAPSRSCSSSSEEAVGPEELTREHVKALKKDLKKNKRRSDACEQEIRRLQEALDLANCKLLYIRSHNIMVLVYIFCVNRSKKPPILYFHKAQITPLKWRKSSIVDRLILRAHLLQYRTPNRILCQSSYHILIL